jgi:hypothetical protein
MLGIHRVSRRLAAALGVVAVIGLLSAARAEEQAPMPRAAGAVGAGAVAKAVPGEMAVLAKEAYLTPP